VVVSPLGSALTLFKDKPLSLARHEKRALFLVGLIQNTLDNFTKGDATINPLALKHLQKTGVSHLLHRLLTRFWDFITNMLISFGIDTCAPL
jgi:hypothetical protein